MPWSRLGAREGRRRTRRWRHYLVPAERSSRTAEENNGICLACHERGERTNWNGSIHETRGLMCTNCHTIMKIVSRKNQLKTVFEPDTCFQCHKDRRAQMFRSSHMPLREGKMTVLGLP